MTYLDVKIGSPDFRCLSCSSGQTRRNALEEAAKVAEAFTNSEWIAHDMRTGIFPEQSKPGIPIAATIRALIDQITAEAMEPAARGEQS